MVLSSLDPNDPQPLKDDPRFAGDKKAFRKADKAWNERERTRRKKLKAEHAEPLVEPAPEPMQQDVPAPLLNASVPLRDPPPHHPKPRGQVPQSGGLPCTWDYERGGWLDQHGQPYMVRSDAERAEDKRARDAAARARTAQELTVLCSEIDAEARDYVLCAGGSLVDVRRVIPPHPIPPRRLETRRQDLPAAAVNAGDVTPHLPAPPHPIPSHPIPPHPITYDQGRGGFPTPEGDFFTSGQEAYIMLAQCATDIP